MRNILRTILKVEGNKKPTWTDRGEKKGRANFFPPYNLVLVLCLAMIKQLVQFPQGQEQQHNPRSKSYCFICDSSIPGQMITANITLLLKSGLGSFKQGYEKTETILFHTVQVTPVYF